MLLQLENGITYEHKQITYAHSYKLPLLM